jgi:type II secretory pathway component PulF
MPLFAYKALRDGAVTNGEIEANDRREALRKLDLQGLQPVKVTDTGAGTDRKQETAPTAGAKAGGGRSPVAEKEIPEGPIKLKRSDVVLFTEELSDMLAAGLQLEPALRAMESRQELGNLKVVSIKLRQIVRDGNSFSNALNRVSPSFGPLYCSLAAAGEASGALDTILKRQAHYLKTLQELQGRVTLALIYPAFLMFSGIMVAIIFVTKLIPQ